MEDILAAFPDRETFDRYWEENYVPVTYEDVKEAFEDFVTSAGGHIFLSDYEEGGCISKEDFKDNLSQEAQFAFQDGLTEVFYDKTRNYMRQPLLFLRRHRCLEIRMQMWQLRFMKHLTACMQSF